MLLTKAMVTVSFSQLFLADTRTQRLCAQGHLYTRPGTRPTHGACMPMTPSTGAVPASLSTISDPLPQSPPR